MEARGLRVNHQVDELTERGTAFRGVLRVTGVAEVRPEHQPEDAWAAGREAHVPEGRRIQSRHRVGGVDGAHGDLDRRVKISEPRGSHGGQQAAEGREVAERRPVREAGPAGDLSKTDAVDALFVQVRARRVDQTVSGTDGDGHVVSVYHFVDNVYCSLRDSGHGSIVRRLNEFSHLLAAGSIGSLALRNRILMAPMGDSLANKDGSISPAQLAYFEARARGGAALLLVGSVAVAYPDGCVDARQVAASDDRFLPGLTELATRVHAHGATVAAQLTYNGALARYDIARGHPMLVPAIPKRSRPDQLSMMVTSEEIAGFMAPHASPTAKVEYQVATDDDLARVIDQFADAANRCHRAGIDGVEIHAGHGYLIDEFLSPALNHREDEWGGSVENRARLLVEIIHTVRRRVGPDYPVWMRINALEHHKPDGETFSDQQQVIALAVAAGLDAVHVTAYANLDVATGPTDSYAPHRVGDLSDYAAKVKASVTVPVITFGRLEPAEAEAVLADGKADFIAIGRKLLADPDLPNKLAAGTVARVRPCLYQYRCIGNIFVNESLACVANAATGREHEAPIPPAAASRRVLVVGGGAAGLEAARVLATEGHAVAIWESAAELGGVLQSVRGVDRVLDAHRAWLIGEITILGVTVEANHTATVATISAAGFDDVVIATGPTWRGGAIPGADLAHVLTPTDLDPDVIAHITDPGAGPIVIIGGGKPGLTLALAFRERGAVVSVLESTGVFGAELGLPGRFRTVADAQTAGIDLIANAGVTEITESTVLTEAGEERRTLPAGTVVIATRSAPDATLADELRGGSTTVHVVGDALDARGFEGITRDAEELARVLAVAEP